VRAILAAVVALLAVPASAAATPIDDRTDPGALFLSAPVLVQSTQAFTTNAGDPASGCTMSRTGWWRIAGTGQEFTVTTHGSNFDTVVAAFLESNTATHWCNDDADAKQTSRIQFPTVRGETYLVEAGGKLSGSYGSLVLTASAPRPANDDRANAVPPDAVDSTGASTEPGELTACGDDHYGATVWFRFTAPAIGDATFSASGIFTAAPNQGDTVMTVYRASDGAVLGCDDNSGASFGSALSLRVGPGDYLVQVGGHEFGAGDAGEGVVDVQVDYAADLDLDGDGSPRPGDCNDADPAIHPGVPDILDDGIDQDCSGADAIDFDRDADGQVRPADCNDANPAIHPGAPDIPGDGVDQDCLAGDAPYPLLGAGITGFFKIYRSYTKFSEFLVRRLPAGTTVTVTCAGRGCPFERRRKVVSEARERLQLIKLVRGAKLRKGARVKVKVTKPLTIGLVTTWRMRAAKAPVRTDRCLRPGESRPGSCPS
jgi:hypothetical protein